MDRKMIASILGLLILSTVIVVVLFLSSDRNRRYQYNTFDRMFPSAPIEIINSLNLDSEDYYFAGTSSHSIYLGRPTRPLHLLITNSSLSDTQHVALKVAPLKYRSIRLQVDSPFFYIMDGTMPFIYKGSVNDQLANRYLFDTIFFSNAIPIAKKSFAFRAIKDYKNIIAKVTVNPYHYDLFPALLEKQIDGLFCTDGMFLHSQELHKLVYVYFYRNQFLYLDTSMNLLSKGRTIDPVQIAQVKAARVTSENALKMAAPALLVNKEACVSVDRLFINSNLMAKNENRRDFDNSSVIDVYNLRTNAYEFSFYIENRSDQKLKSIKVLNNEVLVVLFDKEIVSYKLNNGLFDN